MKSFTIFLALAVVGGLAAVAHAGDYHVGVNLVCSDCHVMHGQQSHDYGDGRIEVPVGAGAPYADLLRNEVNEMCLSCHDNNAQAPDVYGVNTSTGYPGNRMAGGLNSSGAAGLPAPGGTYFGDRGHSLGSTAIAPGGTYANAEGLNCVNCHAQHGSATQWRNMLNRAPLAGKNVTYSKNVFDNTKNVYERDTTNFSPTHYAPANVDFPEAVSQTGSAYASWCQGCHTHFHGAGGSADMGGSIGGYEVNPNSAWLRHPNADVDIGTANATFVSSLAGRYATLTNKVKTMDVNGLWTGTGADTTLTPSCFSCHKAHGNENPFGLIYMKGTGTVTDNGDGGVTKDLCRQCHAQGA